MKPLLSALALLGVLAGCAATDAAPGTQPSEPKQYRTGSNIPIRDAVPLTPEEKEKQRQDARDALDKMMGTNPAKRGS